MRRTTRALLGAAAAAALALSGCAKHEEDLQSGLTSGETGDSEGRFVATDYNPQDRKSLQDGGELRFAISAMPATYNAWNVLGNTVDLVKTVGPFVSPANFIFEEDGSFDVNPNFLTSFDIEHQDGEQSQVVTLHLQKEAVWGDGSPITWKDYEATWNACNGKQSLLTVDEDGPEQSGAEADSEGDEDGSSKGEVHLCASTDGWDHIEDVSAGKNDHEVVITFARAFPDWSAPLASVAPASGVTDPQVFNEGWDTPNNDWFAGPYKFASVDEAQRLITLERNPNWWGLPGMLETITFKAMDAEDMATAFANEKIDVLTEIIDSDQYLAAETRADGVVRKGLSTQWRQFTFNGEAGPLASDEVRQAIVKGIDREEIAAADLAGIPGINPHDLLLGNHFFMPGQQGYKNNGLDYTHDPEAAKEALDAAGWQQTDKYRTKDGKTLEFDYLMVASLPTSTTEGDLLKKQMEELGVKVNIVEADADVFFQEVGDGKFGMVAFAWEGGPYPMASVDQVYSCAQEAPEGQNYSRICDERIDELAGDLAQETNGEARYKLTNEIDEIVWENAMVLPLYRRIEMTAVPKSLANYGAFGMSSVQPENVGFLK